MTDQQLMQYIFSSYGQQIKNLTDGTGIPPGVVGALIGNESGGVLLATRFEKNVLAELWEVVLGRQPNFGSILRAELLKYLVSSGGDFSSGADLLDRLATSWGLTQIMGYELFDYSMQLPTLDKLQTVVGSLSVTVLMLGRFSRQYKIDPADTVDVADLFTCWNTGRPHARTFDPNYVPNASRRMQIYTAIAKAAPPAAGTVTA